MDFLGEKALDKFPDCTNGRLAAMRGSPGDVREAFARHGLLDDRVQLLQGWFDTTLPAAPIERLAVLRLDGDFFKSTMDGLQILYPKLSRGGYCIVDDYHAFPARSSPPLSSWICARSGLLRVCSVVMPGDALGRSARVHARSTARRTASPPKLSTSTTRGSTGARSEPFCSRRTLR